MTATLDRGRFAPEYEGDMIPILIILLSLASLPAGADAAGFYCGSRIVSEGDLKAEVQIKCGEPSWTNVRREEIVEKLGDAFKRRSFVTVEEWFYNLGPQSLLRILRFRDGILVNIETSGYGFLPDAPARAECYDGTRFMTGDTELDTIVKCGPPDSKETKEEEVRLKLDATTERRVTVRVESWFYNFGPSRLVYVLKFTDGRLKEIETRGYGY